jgi:hypothetical protein
MQLLGYFLSWKEIICSCVWQWGLRWKYIMRWPFVFIGFQSEGLEKNLEVLFEKNLSLFLTLIFISMNNNESFVLDVMNLMKKVFFAFW